MIRNRRVDGTQDWRVVTVVGGVSEMRTVTRFILSVNLF